MTNQLLDQFMLILNKHQKMATQKVILEDCIPQHYSFVNNSEGKKSS